MSDFPFQDWVKKKKNIPQVEVWQEGEKKKNRKISFHFDNILRKFLLLAVIIFFAGLTAFLISFFLTSERVKGLTFELSGPENVSALVPTKYFLKINNQSNKVLTDTVLEISLSDGVFFQDKPSEKTTIITLGNLRPGSSLKQDYSLIFFGEENKLEDIEVTFNYKVGKKPQIFSEKRKMSIRVSRSPLTIKDYLPQVVITNQQFTVKFKIENKAEVPYKLQFELETPSYFVFQKVNPLPLKENFWYFENLQPNETKIIEMDGYFTQVPATQFFAYKIKMEWQNIEYVPPEKLLPISIKESPVLLTVNSFPATESVKLGSLINYRIFLENKSSMPILEPEVKVVFNGPFDFENLYTDGYFSLVEESILWNARNKSELKSLDPGEEIWFDFKIKLLNNYPISEDQEKNFAAKVFTEFSTKSIPPEIEITGDVFRVQAELTQKIQGTIEISQTLTYQSEFFTGSGPFPLEPEKETTLTWLITIKTLAEDFKDVTLTTKFPLGVEFLNQAGGDAELSNVFFDSLTGSFTYQIDTLKANLGYGYNEIVLAFPIKVKPPASKDFSRWPVIDDLILKARGDFTQEDFNVQALKIFIQDIQ